MRGFLNVRTGFFAASLLIPLAVTAKTYSAVKAESSLTYHLHHPMHEIEGASKDFGCTVTLSGDTARSAIRVKAPVASFNSGNSSRDSHMLEILDGLKYPFVEFASDSVRHEEKGYRVFGQLTFHGIRRPLDFMVTPVYLKDKIEIKGGFVVLLSDYKVERPALLFVPTANDLHIDLDVILAGS